MPGAGGNTIGGCSAVIIPPAGVPMLDRTALMMLLALLAAVGVFAVNRSTT
jgi:hypothetical protein